MKLFIDRKKREFVKSAASNVTLDRLVLKRRDLVPLEYVFCENAKPVPTPAGTEISCALKLTFADYTFLALASGEPPLLNLNTARIENAFSSGKSSLPALLEVRWSEPGETTRTATLQAELQNSVILGTEGTPAAIPDYQATELEATTGTSNEKWMSPLRTRQAVEKGALASVGFSTSSTPPAAPATGKKMFLNASGEFFSIDSTGQVSPIAVPVSWNDLTGKPTEFAPAAHNHDDRYYTKTQSDTALAGKQPVGNYATLVGGLVPASQLPSYVDDVLEYANLATFPNPGESGKIYVSLDLLKTYRWSGSAYVEISAAQVQSVAGRSGNVTLSSTDITDFSSAVAASAQAPTTPANSGLAITGNSIATSYNSTIADGVVSVSVGGAPAAPASAWKSKNLVQVIDDILFPTLLASVGSAKSTAISVSGATGTLEVGTSVARTLTATFSRGTILNGGGAANPNPLVGAATSYTFTGTGLTSTTQVGNALSFTAAVAAGSNSWAVSVAHGAGSGAYFDNKGVAGTNLDAQRVAGTSSASTGITTGVYPFFYLKSSSPITALSMAAAIQAGTATKVVALSTGTLSIPYAPSAQYVAVAYPATSTTKTIYYVTALDNGAITVIFAPVATQTVSTDLWSQSYKIHVSTGALTNSNATLELRN